MKVLVLGAGGMAGHVVALYLREKGYDIDTLSNKNSLDKATILLNVMELEKFQKILSTGDYDVVINCIGLLIQQSEDRNDLAAYLNSFLPHFLENYYKDKKTRVIHLSTDCVFSGKHAPYKEDAPYDGESFYDRSKALGEIKNKKNLTFRMSIVGPDLNEGGIGLFNWFYKQTGQIQGYSRVMWNGITTIELAKGIDASIKQNLTGLYHLVPSSNISKYHLLKLFKEAFGRTDIQINPKGDVVLDKTLINTRNDFSHKVPSYQIMLKEMRDWINNHPDLYHHYK